jgi:hypothetical protein
VQKKTEHSLALGGADGLIATVGKSNKTALASIDGPDYFLARQREVSQSEVGQG